MAELKDKVKVSLDEARMLVLGAQILLGFQYRSVLQPGFEHLLRATQYLKIVGLLATLLTMTLLMAPAAYQQIIEDGNATYRLHRFGSRVMCWALFPFSLTLGLEVYSAAEKVAGVAFAIALGIAVMLTALYFWYVLEFLARRRGGREEAEVSAKDKQDEKKGTPLFDKIDHALTECRVVIPGAQALLGFQFLATLSDGFDKLPASSKYVHIVSLLLMAFSTILLMTPAAYHRIVELGEESVRMWQHVRRMLLIAMAFLGAGLSGELYVVVEKVTASLAFAIILAAVMLVVFYGLWFGYTSYSRYRKEQCSTASGRIPDMKIA